MSDPNFFPAKIGPSFASECVAAGLGDLLCTWDGTGVQLPPDPSDADRARIVAVIAAHDWTKPKPGALLAYASDRQNAVMAGVWAFNVAAPGAPAHTATTRLDTGGQSAMMKLAIWLQLNAAASGGEHPPVAPYSDADGTPNPLSYAEVDRLVLQAGALDMQSYAIYNRLSAGLAALPPTITTEAQVDAAFAALAPPA